MIDRIDKNKCTGCKMCAELCNFRAILFSTDQEGFWYPHVNTEKCTSCGLCIKKCPALNIAANRNLSPKVFAAWAQNDQIRIKSTSGGIYYVLANSFIEKQDIIVGCAYENDYKGAKHIIGKNQGDLLQIMGSKYFQSDMSGVYKQTKESLLSGKEVLFCGTPCQNAALKAFLGKEYENLYQVDFICRGINSPKAFRAYMEELEEKYGALIDTVQLKNKRTGWQSLATYVKFKNDKEYHKDRYSDWWVRGYIRGNLFMRYVCHNCQYKELPRVSDLSLADFWGVKGFDDREMFKGISAVLVNSIKGQTLLERIKNELVIEERTLEEVLKGNPCLLNKAAKGKGRDEFFRNLDTIPFSKAVKSCFDETSSERLKNNIKRLLKK